MPDDQSPIPPLLNDKHYDAASAFTPESLLREARRQKVLPAAKCPTSAFSIRTATWYAACGQTGA